MADASIRKDFVEGIYEIFTTLFNEGKDDSIKLYRVKESVPNVYGEKKEKLFMAPVQLVNSTRLNPEHGKEDVEDIKDASTFRVPLKSLELNNISVDSTNIDHLRDSIIEFHGVFYEVQIVRPTTYVEDTFMLYTFVCIEDKTIHGMYGDGDEFYTM